MRRIRFASSNRTSRTPKKGDRRRFRPRKRTYHLFSTVPDVYPQFLDELKHRIRAAQTKAALAVNQQLVMLYWEIGREIVARFERSGWGKKIIQRLSKDLRNAFPSMKGFSPRNLEYMRRFAQAWPDEPILQQAAARIPWFHNCVLLDKVKDHGERLWYIDQTIAHGWSRSVLTMQIESGLYARQGKAITNFTKTLPPPQSDLAQQTLKDPYNFDFLTLAEDAQERHLQQSLLNHIREFLLELGVGFAFVGSNVHLEIGDQDFYIDLLFYHLKLRAFVVIDLKMKDFQPEFAGKMNFYLSAIDDRLRHSDDQPSIGLILCKAKNKVVVEYALRDTSKPIGVSEHQFTAALPNALKDQLPTVEQLEAELDAAGNDGD